MLPLNTELRGMIARVRRIGIGLSHETARIDLRFDTLTVPGDQSQPLAGRVSAVDNSRETVDDKGVIHGIRATASTPKVISGLAISAASLDPMSNPSTRAWSFANPAFTASYAGFVNGDTAASLGGALVCSSTATPTSALGPTRSTALVGRPPTTRLPTFLAR